MSSSEEDDYNTSHRPRNSLIRTPPERHKEDVNTGKRKAEEDYALRGHAKRAVLESIEIVDDVFEDGNLDMSRNLEKINKIIRGVREAVSRETESARGKISFGKTEQAKVLHGMSDIYEELVAILTKQQRTLTDLVQEKTKVQIKQEEIQRLKTEIESKDIAYENLLRQNKEQNRKMIEELNSLRFNDGKEGQNDIQNKNKDNAPKPRTRYASIVTLQKGDEMEGMAAENGSPQRRAIKSVLKENLSIDSIGGPTRAIIPLKRGGVLIESYNDGQRRKIGELLKKDTRIEYREVKNIEPVVQLSGVEKGYTDPELIDEIHKQNPFLMNTIGIEGWRAGTKILSRRDCRNRNKQNILMQVRPLFLKAIEANNGKIILDLLSIFAEERLRVAVCHRCAQYGHVQKYCVEQNMIKCPKCAGNHLLSDCTSSVKKCPNCARYGNRDNEPHAATDAECPFYKKRLEIERRKIKYSDEICN
ncbi:hypothetical protein Zmor_004171 [Zophobas morio]|uniref:Gag-like protein n=1 Tax=Zophobas morio TaxID=2755281 RepID=A0AA38HJT1_9CUCU|nr:hypothetical protein Zmor_004171 [Zophobas morio]